ncbi:MAG TPA: tyrosine-type recombinase/integrase, partial [Acidimicrobiia bacterium]
RAAAPGPAASLWLISAGHGGRYTTDGFRAIWQRVMRKHVEAGGERFREHDLRAKVASDQGDLEIARKMLGHQSPATTSKHYRRAPEVIDLGGR